MLYYFKKYLGHVGSTTVASTSFGAICGGVIGVVGLYKISSLDGYGNSMDPYKNITPEEILSHQRYAVGIGALLVLWLVFLLERLFIRLILDFLIFVAID